MKEKVQEKFIIALERLHCANGKVYPVIQQLPGFGFTDLIIAGVLGDDDTNAIKELIAGQSDVRAITTGDYGLKMGVYVVRAYQEVE